MSQTFRTCVFAGILTASTALADPIACASGQTLQFYHDTYGATGCTTGNFVAKNFDYLLVSLLTPNPVSASDIIVTATNSLGGPEFDFSAIWIVTGTGAIEAAILFRLESLGEFGLTSVTLSAEGSRTGSATVAAVTEFNCLGGVLDTSGYALGGIGSVACLGGGVAANTSALLPLGSGVNSTGTVSFSPTTFQVDVLKDITVTGALGGLASVTNIGQQFTEATPEPGTVGLALAGLLAGARALWRKQRKDSPRNVV